MIQDHFEIVLFALNGSEKFCDNAAVGILMH